MVPQIGVAKMRQKIVEIIGNIIGKLELIENGPYLEENSRKIYLGLDGFGSEDGPLFW
jgi:hypothetical protein